MMILLIVYFMMFFDKISQQNMLGFHEHANQIHRNSQNNALWIGDIGAAEDLDWIRQKNIRTVVTAGNGFNLKYDSSVRHCRIAILDSKSQNIFQHFDAVGQKIQKGLKFGSVLVHCGAGVSRSATLVIAYLIKYHKMNFLSALKFTKNRRKEICPNLGFQLQLKKYDILLHKKQNNESFPLINNKKISKKNSGTVYNRSDSPLELMMMSSSFENKKDHETYVKKIAQYRFGFTNMSKWGLK